MLPRSLRPLILLLVVNLHIVTPQPLVPPSIVHGPPANTTYFTDAPNFRLKIPCVATGNPAPRYEWKRNGQPYVPTTTEGDTGTIIIDQPERSAQGDYQCFASNGVGTAMSNTNIVVQSERAVFSTSMTAQAYQARIGDKLRVDCQPSSRGVPSPLFGDYSWDDDDSKTTWPLSRHVQIDDSGNLNIAAVKEGDTDDQRVWKCYISNTQLNVNAGGSESTIVKTDQPAVAKRKPEIMFYTNQTENPGASSTLVVGLEGQTVSLRCFFSGSDDVKVTWSRTDGGNIRLGTRIQLHDFNFRLQISQLERSDEGPYSCSGSNSAGSTPFSLQLRVNAMPTFKQPDQSDRPHDMNTTVGKDVVFKCNAYAVPDASVVWYKDGQQLNPDSAPAKFQFSSDRKTLTVSSVCKTDCGGDNDLMVIQCKATNDHGYVLANGYINVFEPTVFVSIPEDVTPSFPEPVTLRVKATSDPDTEVSYTWYHYDEQSECEEKWCVVYQVANKTHISHDNGSSLTILNTGVDDLGQYRCVASNGVDTVVHEVKLITPPDLDESQLWPYWWVPLIIILIILIILILLLCCCCWMRRNRGDEYPVDEKERAADRDPEKELADSGFHDYQRPTRRDYEDDRQPLTS